MAELVLKVGTVGPDPAYQDGDIIEAFNRRRIRSVHAEHICHLKNFGFTSDGLRPISLAQTFFEETYQYKFERVSQDEVRRTDLTTLDTEIFGSTPNPNGEHIFVELYLARRKSHPKHRIFGTPGNEYWFGGRKNTSHAALDQVWQAIEAQTIEREVNYTKWPLSLEERKAYLAITVDDFTDAESIELTTPVTETYIDRGREGQRIVKKRARFTNFNSLNLSGLEIAAVRARNTQVDMRSKQFTRAAVVSVK